MVLIHQFAQLFRLSFFDRTACLVRYFSNFAEHLFPLTFLLHPQFAYIAHGFFGRRSDAGIADDNEEGLPNFECLKRLAFDKINRPGIRDDRVVDP